MNPEERVWAALNHQQPDRIPIYEAQIEVEEFLRGKSPLTIRPGIAFLSYDALKILTNPALAPMLPLAFKLLKKPQILHPFLKPSVLQTTAVHRELNIDLMSFVGGLPMIFNPRVFTDFKVKGNSVVSPRGDIVSTVSDQKDGAATRNGFLNGPEDYNFYMKFRPNHPANFAILDEALEASKGKIALAMSVFGSAYFESMCELFGFKRLFRFLIKDTKFVQKVVKDLFNYSYTVTERMLEKGVRLFYMSDDLGQKDRGLISPRMYKTFFHEPIRKYVSLVHSYGGKIIRHSCGNFNDFIPFFLEEKIDAVHPWQSTAGMDIFKGKEKYGKKIALIGNMPIELLRSGTHHEVIQYAKKLAEKCGVGGGYIFSSSHSLVRPCKWDNYWAARWAIKKYGTYPI